MPGSDWTSTATILAVAAIAVPSAITVAGFVLHAVYVAGKMSLLTKAVENIYTILGGKANKDDCVLDMGRLDHDIDDSW